MADQIVDMLEAVQRPQVARLQAENARLRVALEEIARKSTQAMNTQYGGRLLREIEVMARTALESEARS